MVLSKNEVLSRNHATHIPERDDYTTTSSVIATINHKYISPRNFQTIGFPETPSVHFLHSLHDFNYAAGSKTLGQDMAVMDSFANTKAARHMPRLRGKI